MKHSEQQLFEEALKHITETFLGVIMRHVSVLRSLYSVNKENSPVNLDGVVSNRIMNTRQIHREQRGRWTNSVPVL